MFIFFIAISFLSTSFGLNVLSQSDILRYEWYTSREFCISLKTIVLQWNKDEMVIILPQNMYAKFSINNSADIYSKLMAHDCIHYPANKLTPHWCGYLPKSNHFTDTTKIRLTSLVGTYALISPENEERNKSHVDVPVTRFEGKLPLPSGLSTDILCRNCVGVCHRPCWSVALGSNKTTCTTVENTTQQTSTTQKCVQAICGKEVKNRQGHKECFYKYLNVLATVSDDAEKCNVSIFLYVIYFSMFFILK